MALIAFSHAVLAAAALVVSAACLLAAPLLAGIADAVARLAAGGAALSLRGRYRRLAALAATRTVEAPGEGVVVAGATVASFAASAAAALLVPGFATGTLLTRFGDLPLVASLLVLARLAAIVAELAPGRSGAITVAVALPFAAGMLLPALLPVASAAASLGAGRTDALPAALLAADPATRILLAAAVAIAAFADLDGERLLGHALSGPVLALAEITGALRLLVWADLLGLFLPPFFIADALGGPLAWGGSLLLWAVRCVVLAAVLGAVRSLTGRLSASAGAASFGAAALLALLAAVFVFISQSFA